jgi:GDP-L-fucose synthase
MFVQNMALQHTPLIAAAKAGVREFLQVSSVCVYAPGHNNPAVEENGDKGEPVGANAGYSWAKRMGEKVALWKIDEVPSMKVVIVRPSNIFGMRDYFDERAHVIPSLLDQVYNDRPYVEVHGDGHTVREFIYADDVASGMIFALAHGESGQVYNLGTNGRTKINTRDLLRLIQRLSGREKEWRPVDAGDTGDVERWSDCSKIEALGWKAETDLETGLREVIGWYEREYRS